MHLGSQPDEIVNVGESLEHVPINEQQIWKKRCIYRIPTSITDLNRKAYRPQVVSFGPYHYGEDYLRAMEEHKQRALLRFLKRSGKPHEHFLKSLREVVQDLEESYEALDPKWKEGGGEGAVSRFLELMVTDGCFMLEILRTATQVLVDDYAPNDPIFSNHGKLHMMPFIRRDMLILENQLPMVVLDRLVAAARDNEKDGELVNELILRFCSPGTHIRGMGKCLHVLDVFRKNLLMEPEKVQPDPDNLKPAGSREFIGSATELEKAGIRFKKSKTNSLKDITFEKGVLSLPVIMVEDTTESIFLNLIAFERLHVEAGSEVTSYIFFMDDIIGNESDVALLRTRDIIQTAIVSDKALAKLFNYLSRDLTLEPDSSLDAVYKKVSDYRKMPLRKCRDNLRRILAHIDSSSLYITVSIVAGILLFGLTIIQTVYSVLSYYK